MLLFTNGGIKRKKSADQLNFQYFLSAKTVRKKTTDVKLELTYLSVQNLVIASQSYKKDYLNEENLFCSMFSRP